MIREIPFNPRGLDALRDEIFALETSEDVLRIRGGAKEIDRHGWVKILADMGLILDRRHFDPNWAATYAQKHVIVAGAAETVQVREEFDTKQAMAPQDWWEVSYQPGKDSAYSYSKTRQPLHTDNAWFADQAPIDFFIMQQQAPSGGEQVIYPASRLIADLSSEEPALYEEVLNTPVTIKKGEGEFSHRTTIIVPGKHPTLYWNYYRTEKPTPAIKSMCDRLFAWLEKKESTSSVERMRCDTKDCFVFNDTRMLHGRGAFTAEKAFDRILLQSMWYLPKAA